MAKERIGITFDVPGDADPIGVYEAEGGAEVFETDEPYLLSDGTSLMPPLPAVLADGPIFTDKMGNAQTALAVTGLAPPGPVPLVFADFANGVYKIEGEAGAVGDVWFSDPVYRPPSNPGFDPETDIQSGYGLVSGAPSLTPSAFAAVGPEFTVVVEFSLLVPAAELQGMAFHLRVQDDEENPRDLRVSGWGPGDGWDEGGDLQIGDDWVEWTYEEIGGLPVKVAATISSEILAASANGRQSISVAPTHQFDLAHLFIHVQDPADPPQWAVKSISFWPPQDSADLPSLSAIGDNPDPDPGPDAVLADIRERMEAAYTETETINYIVSGDSTRDNNYNQMIAYYTHQLAKANITLTDNASSGQSGQDWGANIDSPNLSEAIAATPGTGADTILEYSFGINDYKNGATEAQVKGWLKTGIQDYLAAKPDAAVVLAVPVATAAAERNGVLANIYAELATELSLPLIDTYTIMASVHGDPDYYNDGTHPNKNGSIRIVNYLLSELAPSSLYSVIDLDATFLSGGTPSPDELATTVESGYWSTSTGAPVVNAGWRRMQAIAVEPNFVLRIQHQGNRTDVVFYDEDDVFIETINTTAVSGESYREVTIPAGAFYARINISNDGAAYDLLGDVPSVKFGVSDVPALTMAEINTGLTINLVDNSV